MRKIRIDKLVKKTYKGKSGDYDKLWICQDDEWFGAYAGYWNKSWREGDVIKAYNIVTSTYKGKEYKNIERPTVEYALERLEELEAKINASGETPISQSSEVVEGAPPHTDEDDWPPS